MRTASVSVVLFPLLLSIAPSHVFTHTTATASLQQQQSIAHALAALEAEVEQFHAQQHQHHHTQQPQTSDEDEDVDQGEDKQRVTKPEHVIDPPQKCMVNINGTHVEIGSLLTAYNHPDLTAIAQFCGTAENLYSVVKAVDPQLEHQLSALAKTAFKGVRDWSQKAKQSFKQWQQKPHWFNNYQGLNEIDQKDHVGLEDDEDSRDDKKKPILLLFKKKSSTVITPKSTPENKKFVTEDSKPIQLGGDEDVLNQESDGDLLGGEGGGDDEPELEGPNDGFGADVPEGFDGPNAPYGSDEQFGSDGSDGSEGSDGTDVNPDDQPIDLPPTHGIQNPISSDLTPKPELTNAATALKLTTTAPVQNTPVKQTSALPVAPVKVEAKLSNTVKSVGKGQNPADTKAKTLSALSSDDDQPKQDNKPKNKLVQLGEAIKVKGIKQKSQEGIANLLPNKQNDDSLDEAIEEPPRLPVEMEISDETVNTPPVVDREADETTIDGGLSQDTVTEDLLDKSEHDDEAHTDDAEWQDDNEDAIEPYSENLTANNNDTFFIQHSPSPQSPQQQKLYELKAVIEDILYELRERYLSLQERFVSLYETMKQRVLQHEQVNQVSN